jgi:hypothetical protein
MFSKKRGTEMSKKGWTEVPKTGTARGKDGYRHSKQAEG